MKILKNFIFDRLIPQNEVDIITNIYLATTSFLFLLSPLKYYIENENSFPGELVEDELKLKGEFTNQTSWAYKM